MKEEESVHTTVLLRAGGGHGGGGSHGGGQVRGGLLDPIHSEVAIDLPHITSEVVASMTG